MGVGGESEARVEGIGTWESGSRLRPEDRLWMLLVRSSRRRGRSSTQASWGFVAIEERRADYAAFRNGRSFFSGSRKSMMKGANDGPSPRLPRGGGTALRDRGSRPRNASAGVAPRSP
jgi:hypothetical protein